MEDKQLIRAIQQGYQLPEEYFTVEIKKATDVAEVMDTTELQQLTGSRYRDFYVDTNDVRGLNTVAAIEKRLARKLAPNLKLLFSGFTGSGKTTELIKLYNEMKSKFHIVIFSALQRLKIQELSIESFLFEIMGDLLTYLTDNELVDEKDKILKSFDEAMDHWKKEVKQVKEFSAGASASGGAKAEASIGGGLGGKLKLLVKLFLSIKGEVAYSQKNTETLIEERKLNGLIFECNKIFDYLKQKTGQDTLIIVDDLEKMDLNAARHFYTRNAPFIKQFNCKMLLTIPMELVCHSDYANIQNVFDEAEVLPMIKVRDIEGEPYAPGEELLKSILEQRVDLSLFEEGCYRQAITSSGGSLRELFKIVKRAAVLENGEKISKSSLTRSIAFIRNAFEMRIQERRDEITITFDEYLEALFDIEKGNKRSPEKSPALLDLLKTRAIMKYNGEGFYDIHPLLEDFVARYKKKRETQEGKDE